MTKLERIKENFETAKRDGMFNDVFEADVDWLIQRAELAEELEQPRTIQ